jgi:hypothetical protein
MGPIATLIQNPSNATEHIDVFDPLTVESSRIAKIVNDAPTVGGPDIRVGQHMMISTEGDLPNRTVFGGRAGCSRENRSYRR